jgi:hypothetical protein
MNLEQQQLIEEMQRANWSPEDIAAARQSGLWRQGGPESVQNLNELGEDS